MSICFHDHFVIIFCVMMRVVKVDDSSVFVLYCTCGTFLLSILIDIIYRNKLRNMRYINPHICNQNHF